MTRTRFCPHSGGGDGEDFVVHSQTRARGRVVNSFLDWTADRPGLRAELAVKGKIVVGASKIMEEAFARGQSDFPPVTTSSSARTWLAWLVELESNSEKKTKVLLSVLLRHASSVAAGSDRAGCSLLEVVVTVYSNATCPLLISQVICRDRQVLNKPCRKIRVL